MRRFPKALSIAIAVAVAAVLIVASSKGCSGGSWMLQNVADRFLLPAPQHTVWATSPPPGSHVDSYADASGSYTNYVYEVEAADANGTLFTVTIIYFGREASGEGWLEIDARGATGVHYHGVDESEVPQAARDVLGAG